MVDYEDRRTLQTALSHHQAGRLDIAVKLYRQIIGKNPNNFHALHYLGTIEAAFGHYGEAKSFMDRSLSIRPPNIEFMQNYATILFQMGDFKSALNISTCGLQISSADVPLLYVSAISLFKMKRLDQSLKQFDNLLFRAPNHIAAMNERGSVLAEMRMHDEALSSFNKVLALHPEYALAHLNKGNVLGILMNCEDALTAYNKALALKPDLADAWLGRGNVCSTLKRHDEAFAAYDKALALKPDFADAWLGRGNVFFTLRHHDEAFAAYDKALALKPDLADAWLGLGNVFFSLKRRDEALAAYDKALALKPDLADAWLGHGNVYSSLKRSDEALAAYDKALELKSDLAEAWLGRGNVFSAFKRHDEAFAAYDKALAFNPNLDGAEGARLFSKMQICDWADFKAESRHLMSSIQTGNANANPFFILPITSSAQEQLQCANLWVSTKYPPQQKPLWRRNCYRHDRIRVAYVSTDFRQHAVAHLIAGILELHDRSRFEITAISIGTNDGSQMRQRLQRSFDLFLDADTLSDDEIASRINGSEIDLLVDLNGFTGDARTDVFARRPAPIQVNYLGYPGTMGASYIDYLIADQTIIPAGARHLYLEKIAFLPNTYQANDRKRVISDMVFNRPSQGLPSEEFVFCCFNNSYKLQPHIFDCWMRILTRVERSVLWLLENNSLATINLRKEAVARGVNAERLIFADRMSLPEHLARHALADLFLDTPPYNAHTTASDALWAGLPVLTCIGETFAGRVAASLLNAIRLPELVTATLEDYEHMAVDFATHPEKLTAIKDKLAEHRLTTPLFDTKLFTKHIEAAYIAMYERHQAGLAPDHIVILN